MEGKLIYQSSFIGKTILRKSEVGNGIFIARISVEGYVENLKIIFK